VKALHRSSVGFAANHGSYEGTLGHSVSRSLQSARRNRMKWRSGLVDSGVGLALPPNIPTIPSCCVLIALLLPDAAGKLGGIVFPPRF